MTKRLDFKHPLIMGIVNITPDSFFDGGDYFDPMLAKEHIRDLIEAGADIIDLGAASSRPGYTELDAKEELARLTPLFTALKGKRIVPISIDTDKPEVAEAALKAGVAIINSTGRAQPAEMAELAARYGAYLIIMFRGPFKSTDIIGELKIFFQSECEKAKARGVSKEKIIIDPGIGFDMDADACVTIVRELDKLCALGYPVLMGMSNKRFIGAVSGAPLERRLPGNIAAEIVAVEKGAAMLRVHNVEASVMALKTYRALKGNSMNG